MVMINPLTYSTSIIIILIITVMVVILINPLSYSTRIIMIIITVMVDGGIGDLKAKELLTSVFPYELIQSLVNLCETSHFTVCYFSSDWVFQRYGHHLPHLLYKWSLKWFLTYIAMHCIGESLWNIIFHSMLLLLDGVCQLYGPKPSTSGAWSFTFIELMISQMFTYTRIGESWQNIIFHSAFLEFANVY